MKRYRPSASMIVALVALFVAMGGTTYAVKRLPKRSVGSAQLKKDAVRTRNIKARNVTRSKIAKRSVNSDLVGTDALLGKNILESSLDTVPKAKDAEHATTADKVNGLGVQKFAFRAAVGSSTPSLLSLGGLTLNAACNAGPTPSISATTTVSNAIVHSGGTYGLSSSFYTADNTFNVGDTFDPLTGATGGSDLRGTLVYAREDGGVVSVTYLAQAVGGNCIFAGTAQG